MKKNYKKNYPRANQDKFTGIRAHLKYVGRASDYEPEK